VVLRERDFVRRRCVVESLPWIIANEGKILYDA
jgi:hypothetical protein